MAIDGCRLTASEVGKCRLFIDFIETLDKYVHSFEEMPKPDDRENDSYDIVPETVTTVWILVDE